MRAPQARKNGEESEEVYGLEDEDYTAQVNEQQ